MSWVSAIGVGVTVATIVSAEAGAAAEAERINHEGRLLGELPEVTEPLLFNTPEADAVVSAMQVMPMDSPWNEDVSGRPLLANSDAMIAQIKSELDASRRTLRLFEEMNYVLVPEDQPAVPVEFFYYSDESDLDGGTDPYGLYPIPANQPVETWPTGTGSLTLEDWQADVNDDGGDRHAIVVKPGSGWIWETWLMKRVGNDWQASNGAKFPLHSNALRPAGWTSGDAAGLPMFPALVRYDEVERGMVEHAMRIVVKHTRHEYIYPARHRASVPQTSDPNVPAMGQRLRLKADFDLSSGWTAQELAVLRGLKKYGALVADNGNFFSISITPDDRYPEGCFDGIRTIGIDNFEVVQSTGPTEGPRSPGAPAVDAGPNRSAIAGETVSLVGLVSTSGPVSVQWAKYSGPGSVDLTDADQAAATASMALPGTYVLMLSAADGVHAVAYDAVTLEVRLPVSVALDGQDVRISFPTAIGVDYQVEKGGGFGNWTNLGSAMSGTGSVVEVGDVGAVGAGRSFYRVRVTE